MSDFDVKNTTLMFEIVLGRSVFFQVNFNKSLVFFELVEYLHNGLSIIWEHFCYTGPQKKYREKYV